MLEPQTEVGIHAAVEELLRAVPRRRRRRYCRLRLWLVLLLMLLLTMMMIPHNDTFSANHPETMHYMRAKRKEKVRACVFLCV